MPNGLSSYKSTVKKQDHQITEEAEKSKGELRVSIFWRLGSCNSRPNTDDFRILGSK